MFFNIINKSINASSLHNIGNIFNFLPVKPIVTCHSVMVLVITFSIRLMEKPKMKILHLANPDLEVGLKLA